MGRYSLDLRERVIDTYEQGKSSIRQIAQRFQVNKNTVHSWLKRKRNTGSVVASPATGGKVSKLLGYEQKLATMVAEHPDYTLSEYCQTWLEKQGMWLDESTMCRWLQQQQLTLKKKQDAASKPRLRKVNNSALIIGCKSEK